MKTYYSPGYRYWYDIHLKMWTVLIVDKEGNQIGHAEYFGNRGQLVTNYPNFNFKTVEPCKE